MALDQKKSSTLTQTPRLATVGQKWGAVAERREDFFVCFAVALTRSQKCGACPLLSAHFDIAHLPVCYIGTHKPVLFNTLPS